MNINVGPPRNYAREAIDMLTHQKEWEDAWRAAQKATTPAPAATTPTTPAATTTTAQIESAPLEFLKDSIEAEGAW